MNKPPSPTDIAAAGRRVLEIESRAIADLVPRVGADFEAACRLCMECEGRVVVTGMGKSGHVAGKIAATLASTGTPAFFVHPAEASHGDMGMITRGDVVIALSNSGETTEVLTLLPLLKRLGVALIAMTGESASTLAAAAAVTLDLSVSEEACPLNLAPTASTTAALAMGDALAIAMLEARGFTAEDFALSHPGGALGRKLLLRVEDLMHTGDEIPSVSPATSLTDGMLEMSGKGLGMTGVCDGEGKLLGVFTDGDLRRTLDNGVDMRTATMQEVMTTGAKTVSPEMLAAEAVHIIEQHKINALLVTDTAGTLVGALNIHDLFRAGVM